MWHLIKAVDGWNILPVTLYVCLLIPVYRKYIFIIRLFFWINVWGGGSIYWLIHVASSLSIHLYIYAVDAILLGHFGSRVFGPVEWLTWIGELLVWCNKHQLVINANNNAKPTCVWSKELFTVVCLNLSVGSTIEEISIRRQRKHEHHHWSATRQC